MSHSVPFCSIIALLANVHCSESLVWFKAFGFWYTITKAPLGSLAATLSHGDPVVIPQDQPLHKLQQVLDRVDVRVGQPRNGCGPG